MKMASTVELGAEVQKMAEEVLNVELVEDTKELERVLAGMVYNPDGKGLAVREEINLAFSNPILLLERLLKFYEDCAYDNKAEMRLDGTVLYLEGTRPLTLDEAQSFEKGLFDDK